MPKRKQIDWEAIEKEYRLGQKSIRTIATEFGIAHSSITRRAKRDDWVQDKSEEVQLRTKVALLAENKRTREDTKKRTTPTREDIDATVSTNIEVIKGHRKDIRKGRELVHILSSQLRYAAENREEIKNDIEIDTEDNGSGKPELKRRNAMLKSVSLPQHAATLRDLSTALKNLIPLERQAFNLNDAPVGTTQEKALEELGE